MDHETISALQNAYQLLKDGNQQEALAILDPIVQANSEIAEAWYLLGFALTDPDKRIYAFRQVLRINPSNQPAQKQLEKLSAAFPTNEPQKTSHSSKTRSKRRKQVTLLWTVLGRIIFLASLIVFGGLWWVSQQMASSQVSHPTPLIRHPAQRPTVTPYAHRATGTFIPIATTLVPVMTFTPKNTPTLMSNSDFIRTMTAIPPAPTANVPPDMDIFTNKDVHWEPAKLGEKKSGLIKTGQSISTQLMVEFVNEVGFILSWTSAKKPTVSFVAPDGKRFDKAYAFAHPDKFTVSDDPSAFSGAYTYSVKNPVAGVWTVNISADEDSAYNVYAVFGDSPITFWVASSPSYFYHSGDVVTIGGILSNKDGGISGATVKAIVSFVEGVDETPTQQSILLNDVGDGDYAASYHIPGNVTGYVSVEIMASSGSEEDKVTRSGLLVLAVSSNNFQLTNQYSETPHDNDGDGRYETLDLTVGVNLALAGKYYISAQLYADTQMVAMVYSNLLDLKQGEQTITLSFRGVDIADGGLNGPYTVKHLFITEGKTGIMVQDATDVFTTASYKADQFGEVHLAITGNTGAPGVRITYTDDRTHEAESDDKGNYVIIVPYHWSGKIRMYKFGYEFTPETLTYSDITTDQENQDTLGEPIFYTITGNTKVGNVTLTFTTKDGVVKKTKSDSNGNYSLILPFASEGQLVASLPGRVFSPDHLAYVLGGNIRLANFEPGYIISGNVGVGGVEFYGVPGGAVISKPDGSYSLVFPEGWSGAIEPYSPKYTFAPARREYTNLQSNQTNQNYIATLK